MGNSVMALFSKLDIQQKMLCVTELGFLIPLEMTEH